MKPCIIKQPAGVGDVFFLQKVASIYRDKVMKSSGLYEMILFGSLSTFLVSVGVNYLIG